MREKGLGPEDSEMNGADSLLSGHEKAGGHRDRPCEVHFLHPLSMVGLVVAMVFLLPLTIGASTSATEPREGKVARTLLVDGRQVPVFPTPEEQLRYARSTFDETEEKAAALKAVELVFPEAREQTATAALELAYLALGEDYRLADRNQRLLAKNSYLAVLDRYPELPVVAAKALWYLGWLACDLEGDTRQGVAWYRRLIDLYPEERLSSAAPVPWLTIRPADPYNQYAAYPKAVLTWRHIAHLEIVRHAANREEAWQSFSAIRQAGAGEFLTGIALKVLVEAHGFDAQSEQLAREYLQRSDFDAGLKNDLLLALSAQRRQASPEGPR